VTSVAAVSGTSLAPFDGEAGRRGNGEVKKADYFTQRSTTPWVNVGAISALLQQKEAPLFFTIYELAI
jgi:hypothetical protein